MCHWQFAICAEIEQMVLCRLPTVRDSSFRTANRAACTVFAGAYLERFTRGLTLVKKR